MPFLLGFDGIFFRGLYAIYTGFMDLYGGFIWDFSGIFLEELSLNGIGEWDERGFSKRDFTTKSEDVNSFYHRISPSCGRWPILVR